MLEATRHAAALLVAALVAWPASAGAGPVPSAVSPAPPRPSDDPAFDKAWAAPFVALKNTAGFLLEAMVDEHFTPGEAQRLSALEHDRRKLRGLEETEVHQSRIGAETVPDPSCGCLVDASGRLSDPTHCLAMRGDPDEADAHVGSIPLIDPLALASPLACFRRGQCDIDGVSYGGLTCCVRGNREFTGALRDPRFHLLAPYALSKEVEGLVPGGAAPGSPQICGFAIDRANGVFSIPPRFDGLVARAWLYASQHYAARTPAPLATLASISAHAPASDFEVARERLTRYMYNSPSRLLDGALRSTPPSPGFKSMGIVE